LLYKPELLIDLIPEDLPKEADVGVLFGEPLYPIDDGSCPLND
jgi:hypothetical protein